jgi:hypothetical protein
MEQTVEQKYEDLKERVRTIQAILREPLQHNDKLKLGKAAQETFKALAAHGIPYGYAPIYPLPSKQEKG